MLGWISLVFRLSRPDLDIVTREHLLYTHARWDYMNTAYTNQTTRKTVYRRAELSGLQLV